MKQPIKILCTKTMMPSQADLFAQTGITLDMIPFIKTIPVADIATINVVKNWSFTKATVVFTSSKSVEIIASMLDAIPEHWKVICIAQQTLSSVKTHFPNAKIVATADHAQDLVQLMHPIQSSDEPFVFFGSDKRLPTLFDYFASQQIILHEVTVYHTIPLQHKITENYDGIIFCSPSAVHSFFENNIWANNQVAYSIGATTARALAAYLSPSNITIHTAPHPTMESILKTILQQY